MKKHSGFHRKMSTPQDQAEEDSVPLVHELAATPAASNSCLQRNRQTLCRAVWVFINILSTALLVACLLVRVPHSVGERPIAQTECFRYTNLNESQQPGGDCKHALAGNCSTTAGMCVAFAFLSDTNASSVGSGSMYRCRDPACTDVGDECSCANPAIVHKTAFCRRHVAGQEYGGANFACV